MGVCSSSCQTLIGVNQLKESTRHLSSEVSRIRYDVNANKNAINALAGEMGNVKSDVKRLKYEFSEIKTSVDHISMVGAQILGIVEKNLAALGRNHVAIQSVERRLNETFAVTQSRLTALESKMDTALSSIEDAKNMIIDKIKRMEMNILDHLKRDKINTIKSKLISFADYFKAERDNLSKLKAKDRVEMLTNPRGILSNLLDSRTPQSHSLYSLLTDIINQGLAIPADGSDEIAFVALDILFYGMQVYSLIVLFLVENYSLLADTSYQKNDLKQFNAYISTGVRDFNSFSNTMQFFLEKITNVIDEVNGKEFIQIERRDIVDFILIKSEAMRSIKTGLKDIEGMLPVEVPENRYLIVEKPYFAKESIIKTPIGLWIDKSVVSYAIQFKNDSANTLSKLGDWSDPFKIRGNANPLVKLPMASRGQQTRLIFRKFDESAPELVGIITNGNQVEFRDINREVFNAAGESHEDDAIVEIDFYVKNGADVNAVFEQGKVPLHRAAKRNNLDVALTLLKYGATVDAKDVNGMTAMHIAAKAGFDNFVIELLNNRADINVRNNLGQTPLHIAAYQNQISLLSTLLQNDQVKVNAKTSDGLTPLHAAAVTGNVEIVEELTGDKRININAITNLKYTSLHLAATFNFHEVVKVLMNTVEKEVDVNAKAVDDTTPLHLAATFGSFDVVQLLLADSGINVNAVQSNGFTPLHLAIKYEKYDVALELLKRDNIEVNIQGSADRLTPLHLAAINGNEQVLTRLLEKGARLDLLAADDLTALHFAVANAKTKVMLKLLKTSNLQAKTSEGAVPLHLAALSGNEDITKRLVGSTNFVDIKDRKEYTPLYVAFKYNNTRAAQELLDNDANIRLRLSDYKSLLHFASKNGDQNAVANLLEYDVNVNSGDSNFVSPLHYAAQNGHAEIVQMLLDQGANANAPDRNNMTPLHYIAKLDGNAALEMAGILVRKNADINAYNKDHFTMLHIAAQSGNYRLVKFLIGNKADVNFTINQSSTPLHVAAENNRFDIVKLMLSNGADVSVVNAAGVTPLHAAVKGKGEFKVIKLLTDKGSKVNTIDSSGSNLVDDAVVAGKMDVVMFLIDKSVDLNALKKDGWTLLHYAAREGNLRLVRMLLKMGSRQASNINAKNINWEIPLHVAIKGKGNLELVQFMVENGADYTSRDKQDTTLAMQAAVQSKFDVAQFLIEKGASVNSPDRFGLTPLHIAAFNGNYDFVLWLLDNGADIDARSNEEQSPVHAAIKGKGDLKLILLFVQKNADLKTHDKQSVTLVHEAVAWDKVDIARFLIERQIDFNTQTDTGDSVLHFAAKNGNIPMVELLLEKGANVDVLNKEGRTPLHVAIRGNGNLDLVKLFVNNGAYLTLKDKARYTLLDEAIEKGKIEIAQFLILQGVQVGHLTKSGWTLLHHAAKDGMLEFVKFILLKEPQMIHSKNELGETPLMIAIKEKGNLDMVEYFIDNGADVNAKDNKGETLLHEAALTDKVDVARMLVKRDVSLVNSVDNKGYTPLHNAASVDNLEMLKFLFDLQKDSFAPTQSGDAKFAVELAQQNDAKRVVQFLLSARNKLGETMLHQMAAKGDLRMVKILLENGAVVDELNSDKMAAIHLAAKNGHVNVVKYLVGEKCSNPELKNGKNESSLLLAEQEGHQPVVEYLLNNRKLENAITRGNIDLLKQLASQGVAIKCPIIPNKGWTALHLAAFAGQLDVVKFLIQNGVSLYDHTRDGKTPLDLAQTAAKSDVVKALKDFTQLLIQAINDNNLDNVKQHIRDGADVNMKSDEKGNTSLHVAAEGGKLKIVKYLVEHCGANIHSETNGKQIPLELAILKVHQPVVNYLMERSRVELYNAITSNNMQKVKFHLRGWDIVNGNDTKGWTALHVAAYHGYPEIVEYLLQNGASTGVKATDGSTPLDLARKRGKREVVRSLINTVNNQGSFMLHEAAGRGDLRAVRSLIDNNAAVNAKNTKGETPIQVAVKNSGSLEMVQFLVNSGADIQTKDQNGFSLIFNAIVIGKIDIVKYLIEKGTDINAANNEGWTPLHEAVSKGNFNLVKFLLTQDTSRVNIDAKTSDGRTAFHLMINDQSSLNMAVLLVQCGADIKAKDKHDRSLVLQAIVKNRFDIAEFLIGEGADLHSPNINGWTPLHEAAKRGNIELTRLLLKHGAQFDAKTKDNETPLEIADTFEKVEIISMLVKFEDSQGRTMLHHAAGKGEFSNVRYLLDKGSQVNALDKAGDMPIHLAAQSGHQAVATALVEKGANVCAKSSLGLTPLEIARKFNDSKMIEFFQTNALMPLINLMALENNSADKIKDLISKGTNINCPNVDSGWTALHYAADLGNINVVKLLIQSGANISALAKDSIDAVQLAENKKYPAVVKILINSIDVNLGYALLHVASANGELEKVQALLSKGASLNIKNSRNVIPLHSAAANNQFDVVKFMLQQKSPIAGSKIINARTVNGETPLSYAINNKGDLKLVQLLSENGADLRSTDLFGNTYVNNAVAKGKKDVFDFLVQNGVDFNLPNKNGWTPLHIAALNGNTMIVESLIEKKARLDNRNVDGKTPLHVAVSGVKSKQNDETIKLLINSSSNVNSQDSAGNSIVLESILKDKLSFTKLLVNKGADVNVVNKDGWSALHEAAKIGNNDLIKFLLSKGANVNAKDKDGKTPLQVVVRVSGQLSLAKLFISNGADVKTKDKDSSSLLIDAAKANSLPLVKELISKKVDVNAANKDGNTPLHEAAKHDTVNLLQYLLFQNTIIDAKNNLGQTPLQVAVCGKGTMNNLVYFFAKDANIQTSDKRKTGLILDAAILGKNDIVDFLTTKGANLNAANIDGLTPLHAAAKNGNLELVEFLSDNNARLDAKDIKGWTALHYAADGGWLPVVTKLVESGVNVNSKNNEGKRPLDLVINSKKFDIAKFLIAQKDTPVKTVPRVARSIRVRKLSRNIRNVYEPASLELTKQVATNSGLRSSSWINNAVNLAIESFNDASQFIFGSKWKYLPKDFSGDLKPSFNSQNIDVNSSLLLLDVAIRMFTGQRYETTAEHSMTVHDARSSALNIVSKFDRVLNDSFANSDQDFDKTNLNTFELFKSVESLLISGEHTKIPAELLSSFQQANSKLVDKNEKFLMILKESIQQMLSDYSNTLLNDSNEESDDSLHFISQHLKSINLNKPNLRLGEKTIFKHVQQINSN